MSVITDLIDENSSCNARIAELEARIVWLECEAQVNAAPVSEAKAHGVVMPAELDRAFITGESCDGVYRVVIQSEKLKEMQSVHRWLASLNAAPVQQVSVPDGWRDGYRAAMNSAASGARQLYVQHCHHHGVNGLLDRCKELEQSFIRDADAAASAAPAAPAADSGVRCDE